LIGDLNKKQWFWHFQLTFKNLAENLNTKIRLQSSKRPIPNESRESTTREADPAPRADVVLSVDTTSDPGRDGSWRTSLLPPRFCSRRTSDNNWAKFRRRHVRKKSSNRVRSISNLASTASKHKGKSITN
jgi:hypothetical protein